MRILRKENAERTGWCGDPACRGIAEKLDVIVSAVIGHRLAAIGKCPPSHLVNTLQNQLNVDVLTMAFQLRHFTAASGDIFHDDEQILSDDGITPGRKGEQVGDADEVKALYAV